MFPPRPRRLLLLSLLLAAAGLALDCPRGPQGELKLTGRTSSLLLAEPAPAPQPATLHALLINGGADYRINYRSHAHHIERMLGLLDAAGVERSRVSVFSSDGADPTPDQAILDGREPDDFWLLPRESVGRLVAAQMEFVSTAIEGAALRPATRAELSKWFAEEGSKLQPGETLLIYVTDHGNENEQDRDDNTIALWNGEMLGVREFQEFLDRLDPGVRVVMLMSQCFGGAFANAIFSPAAQGALRENVCGYFATTADRPAYGCYPENVGRDDVGHSEEIFSAWSQLGELQRAHRRSLITDETPDVPNTSRDFLLRRFLAAEAGFGGKLDPLVDRWLKEAWRDRAAWEPEIRLLDQISHTFGLFSPRSLAEFEAQADALPPLSEQLDTYADRWEQALEAARVETWLRFIAKHPEWKTRLEANAVGALAADKRQALRDELLAAYAPFVATDGDTRERLRSLRQKAEDARTTLYRTEMRIGAVLRMRTLLTSIASRTWLEREGSQEQRDADARMARCEAFTLAAPPATAVAFQAPEPLPPLEDDRKRIESVMPSWMGVSYQPVRAQRKADPELPRGAVKVTTVFPDSPAASAGLRIGDVVLGADGKRFEEMHAIREWTMRSEQGRPAQLELQRTGKPLELTLVPGPFPLQLPELPGPPKVGSTAPALELELQRGVAQTGAHARLLFFWATWCGPCKQSLPELVAFGEQQGVEVVAISDEDPEQIDRFLKGFRGAFPENVASDPERTIFQAYGVSATPTFVLVDADGVVQVYQRGYSTEQGLQVEGWKYLGAER